MPSVNEWGLTPSDYAAGDFAASQLFDHVMSKRHLNAAQRSRALEYALQQMFGTLNAAEIVQDYVVGMREGLAPKKALVKAMGGKLAQKLRATGPAASLGALGVNQTTSWLTTAGSNASPSRVTASAPAVTSSKQVGTGPVTINDTKATASSTSGSDWLTSITGGIAEVGRMAVDVWTGVEERRSEERQADFDRRMQETTSQREYDLSIARLKNEEQLAASASNLSQPSGDGALMQGGQGAAAPNNTLLYVGLGVGAVVVLGGIALFVGKK